MSTLVTFPTEYIGESLFSRSIIFNFPRNLENSEYQSSTLNFMRVTKYVPGLYGKILRAKLNP